MADFNQINQFGSAKPARSGEGMSCAECEALLADAIDGTLSAKDQAAFDLHISTCAECSKMLADAQRGAALLEMLKTSRPEPSALLFDRIIAQTSGQISQPAVAPVIVSNFPEAAFGFVPFAPAAVPPTLANVAMNNVLPFRSRVGVKFSLHSFGRTMLQPRLAMTAAMAFFSIALTLNLTGVHLSELKANDLKPSSLKRSLYQADASLVRYYDNLRVVYELESRVRDLQRSNESENAPDAAKPDGKDGKPKSGSDQQRKSPKAGSGTSRRDNPFQQEFKLASGHSNARRGFELGMAVSYAAAQPGNTNKWKEETQEEGGLV